MMENLNFLRNLIIEGNARKALEEMLSMLQKSSHLQTQLRDDIVLLRAQLGELEHKESLNLISTDEASRERAQLQKAILNVITAMESPEQTPAPKHIAAVPATPDGSTNAPKRNLRVLVVAGIAALLLLGGLFLFKDYFWSAPEPVVQKETEQPVAAVPKPADDPVPISPQQAPMEPSAGTTQSHHGGKKDPPKPADLSFKDFFIRPNTPLYKQPVEISVIVMNTGEMAANNFKVAWWASASAPNPAKEWTVSLPGGMQQQLSYTYPGYPSWYENLQTVVEADREHVISERFRNNNKLVQTIRVVKPPETPKPDLTFVGWSFDPNPPVEGSQTTVKFAIQNKGTGNAVNFDVQWWAGVNYPGPEKTWTGITLNAGERKDFIYNYSGYPSWYGSLQTKIVLDPGRKIIDADVSDNEWVKTIQVKQAPKPPAQLADLRIVSITFNPATPVKGENTQVYVRIENKGAATATNFDVQWWAGSRYPSPEKTWTGLSLQPGQSQNLSYTYAGYPSFYSNIETKAVVDPGRRINDANRSDNEMIKSITVKNSEPPVNPPVGSPDLTFVGWTFDPSPPVQGRPVQVKVTIENKGSAAASNLEVQWWAGVNFPGPAKTWTGITLQPREKRTLTYTYNGYSSWYGNLQTKVVIDPNRRVNDANRSDNEWVRSISVSKPL